MKKLSRINIKEYNQAESYVHHLAQFPAIIGRNLTTRKPDDSNSTLRWNADEKRLESEMVNDEFQLCVSIPSFSLQWINRDRLIGELPAEEKTKDQIFDWVKGMVRDSDLDESKLHYIDHYEVPQHSVDRGEPFLKPLDKIMDGWIAHRTNANEMLAQLNKVVNEDSEIRVWPHHFDTGTYYPFGDKKAIGSGWAIGDAMSEYPYLYIYPWNADAKIDLSDARTLKSGKWLNDTWVGAVLPLNEMIEASDLKELTSEFIKNVTEELKEKLAVYI